MEFLAQNPSGKILAEIHVEFHVGFSRENRVENIDIDPYRSTDLAGRLQNRIWKFIQKPTDGLFGIPYRTYL